MGPSLWLCILNLCSSRNSRKILYVVEDGFLLSSICFMHKCLIYMCYQNNNISVWTSLTRRMAAGSCRVLCSIANPGQVGAYWGGDDREIPCCTERVKVCLACYSWCWFWVTAGASATVGDCPSCHLAVLVAGHICLVFSPVGSSVENLKLLWSISLKHLFLV